jgi:hypothetical protein
LVGGQSSINCLSLMICCCLVGQVPAPQPALRGRPNWLKWNVHHWEFLVVQLGKFPAPNPPPGGGKSVKVNHLQLRISCCSVGHAPAPQPAPRGRPNWSK